MISRVFLFGAGYSARAFARAIAGEAELVGGTTRSADRTGTLRAAGIAPFEFEGGEGLSGDIAETLKTITHLVVSAAPGEAGDPVLASAGPTIRRAMPALQWIGYLSTVGVYGDHGGALVDENSECRPVSPRSHARLAAEKAWATLGVETGKPVAILRLSGIYGPGRNALVNVEKGKARRIVKPGQVFNRIHVDDITGALSHLAGRGEGGVFNVTDDLPGPPQDVVEHAARLTGMAPPPEIPFEEAELSPMARSFWAECKRVANARIKAAGYRFRHPDYRSGLDTMWREGTWRGEPA